MDDNDVVVDVVAVIVVVEIVEEVTEVDADEGNEEELDLTAELVDEFVMTFSAVLTPAKEVGVPRLIGGVLAFGGGGSCCVSTFS